MGVGAQHRAPIPFSSRSHHRDARRTMHNMSVRQYERLRRIIAKPDACEYLTPSARSTSTRTTAGPTFSAAVAAKDGAPE